MLKIKGLKKIAGESKGLNPYDHGYLQVNYDMETGEAWTDYHYSIGSNSWSEYHDEDILTCGYISSPHTMEQIREMIECTVWQCQEGARIAAEQRAALEAIDREWESCHD